MKKPFNSNGKTSCFHSSDFLKKSNSFFKKNSKHFNSDQTLKNPLNFYTENPQVVTAYFDILIAERFEIINTLISINKKLYKERKISQSVYLKNRYIFSDHIEFVSNQIAKALTDNSGLKESFIDIINDRNNLEKFNMALYSIPVHEG